MAKPKDRVDLKLNYNDHNFRWRAFFNAYKVETRPTGKLIMFGFEDPSCERPEVATILLSHGGLNRLKESTQSYLATGGPVPTGVNVKEPRGRIHTPEMANHVNCARSEGVGELAFYLIRIHEIANVISGKIPGDEINPLPIAVFHSDINTHQRILFDILEDI